MEDVSGDDIADVVLKQFDKLSNKRKPQDRGQGRREWVPLSGVVAQVPVSPGNGNLVCIALATGMKCLPQSKIEQAQGIVLHDWHAEILAIRSFNRFLLEECYDLVFSGKEKSEYVRLRSPEEITQEHFQPFALKDGISLHMYCSEAPCGDASMELTMAAQEDSSPWSLPATEDADAKVSSPLMKNPYAPTVLPTVLHGRGYFSELGIVRRKPSRPDAPPTLSKSCSDKLALKQSTSLLSSITSLLIHPGNSYLTSLIIPSSQFSQVACDRAFGPNGRLSPIHHIFSEWLSGYRFAPFTIKTTEREFSYSRRSAGSTGPLVPSNIAASWTGNGKEETIINGTLQGRRQFDIRGASRMCKRRMWKITLEIAAVSCAHGIPMLKDLSHATLYEDVKEMSCLTDRRLVKEEVRNSSLKGWIKNRGEEFEIDGIEA